MALKIVAAATKTIRTVLAMMRKRVTRIVVVTIANSSGKNVVIYEMQS